MSELAPADTAFFEQLPMEVRQDAFAWAEALAAIVKPIGKALRSLAARFGVSHKTARRKYDDWRKLGIRGLVNCSRAGISKDALHGRSGSNGFEYGAKHPEFIAYAKAKAESYQRNTRAAWRQFVREWKNGHQIPGLDNSLPRHHRPKGTGYDNFLRIINDAFALEATRSGLGSAIAKYGPQIFTTRAQLWYGSHYMIDDLWHDNFVIFGHQSSSQIVRVLELDCLDVFSGYLVGWGCKPRVQKTDGTMENLKQKYAHLLVANILFNEGYSPRGTTFIAEHGTAAISELIESILARYAGKLPNGQPVISVRRSGITGEEQAVIGWRGQGKGNPRFKAALESLRSLKHNELAFIPAQTGKDRDSRPEYTHGLLVQASEELKVLANLARKDPARAAQMRLRLLDYHAHFLPLLMDVYREINDRDWHELEGWHAAGNVQTEYRMSPSADHWLTNDEFLSLPAVSQQLLITTAEADKRYIQTRRMSPAEVRGRDGGALRRLPAFVIAEILGPDFAREETVQGAYFKPFQDQELHPEPLRYESVITTPDGREEQLRDGTYLLYLNPFDLQQVFVHDAAKRFLGTARLEARINRMDPDQLARAHGRRAHRLAELKRPILQRHAAEVKTETDRLKHNTQIIEDIEGITEQKSTTRRLGKFAGDPADLLTTSETTDTSDPSAPSDLDPSTLL